MKVNYLKKICICFANKRFRFFFQPIIGDPLKFFIFLFLIHQASKEKISFGRLEVHELAAFVRNPNGKYEAVNRNHLNYYLSDESVALFTEQHSTQPAYIIGQVVHIERCVVQSDMSSSRSGSGSRFGLNPYSLPVGSEYFMVTVALLPDTIRSSAS